MKACGIPSRITCNAITQEQNIAVVHTYTGKRGLKRTVIQISMAKKGKKGPKKERNREEMKTKERKERKNETKIIMHALKFASTANPMMCPGDGPT